MSNSIFRVFYLQGLSYEEGKEEMVNKYGLFDDETYNKLFQLFGGHVYFYRYYWVKRSLGMNHKEIIELLMQKARITLNVCLMNSKDYYEQMVSLLLQLKEKKFWLEKYNVLTVAAKCLIECNVIFFDSNESVLLVQNPLLEKAIANKLSQSRMFCNLCN